jgi:predicted NBD/HSP70 family sugar kinase
MGLPGPIDRRTGTVGSSVILPGWAGLKAAEELSRRIDFHVEVDNDANLGALAEFSLGAGRGAEDIVYIKVSSGIGAGLVLGGRLHHGATGIAGEIGHVQVRQDGAVCRCGNRGCLETVASSLAVARLLARSRDEPVSIERLLELAARGDRGANRAVAEAAQAVGEALATVVNLFNPELILVGGDLAATGDILLGPLRTAIEQYAIAPAANSVTVSAGALGDKAEVLGAVALILGESPAILATGAPSTAASPGTHGPI